MTHQEAVDTLATERYLLDEMAAKDREIFEAHYFQCEICADDLRVATAMLQGAKEGLAGTANGSHVMPMAAHRRTDRKPAWYRSAVIPWAAAATLAVLAGYESLWLLPSLRQGASPLALTPYTLRPASRGAEPTVTVGAHGEPTMLAVEINETPQSREVKYDLSRSDGRSIVSGRAAAPAAGAPLLLLMPSWTLVAPMHYILSVHDAAGSGRLLGEYRFVVSAP
jgi:hypothetical protein